MTTRLQITDAIYTEMGIKSDSTVFERNAVVLPKLQNILNNIAAGKITSILDKTQTFDVPLIEQLSRSIFFYNPVSGTLNADANIGDVTIDIDTTNYLTSGTVCINENCISYTGKSATQLTGVTGILMKHYAGDDVYQVFERPVNLYKNYELIDVKNPSPALPFIDDRNPKFGLYWTMKIAADGTTFYIYCNQQDINCKLSYYKVADVLSDDTTACEFPDNIVYGVIIPLCAGELLVEKYSDDGVLGTRGKGALAKAYAGLSTVYGQYAERTKQTRKIVQRKPWGGI